MKAKSIRITFVVLTMYAILVSVNLGEFWPFSIYPMFSQGGKNWSRAVVREVDSEGTVSWNPTAAPGLPGSPYALTPNGIDPIDLANFVAKTRTWDADRQRGIQSIFLPVIGNRNLLIFRVDGSMSSTDSVEVTFDPYIFVTEDTVFTNPKLSQ